MELNLVFRKFCQKLLHLNLVFGRFRERRPARSRTRNPLSQDPQCSNTDHFRKFEKKDVIFLEKKHTLNILHLQRSRSEFPETLLQGETAFLDKQGKISRTETRF